GSLRRVVADRGRRRARQAAAHPVAGDRPQAALPREARREQRRPAAELLLPRRRRRAGRVRRQQLRRRPAVRKACAASVALLALVLAPAAAAGVRISGVDTSGYPEIRVTVVAPAGAAQPRLGENGLPAAGLQA